jgi:hypothetical protein
MTFHRNTRAAVVLLLSGLVAGGVHAAGSDIKESTDALIRQMEQINQRIGSNADALEEAGERTRRLSEGEDVSALPEIDGMLAPIPEVVAPPGSDPMRIMTARMTNYVNRNIGISNQYQRDLDAIEIATLLSPSSYATDESVEAMPKRIALADRAYRRMVRDARESTRAFAAQMRSGDLPKEAIEGFNESFQDGRALEEQVAMEGRVLIHIASIVAFLVEKRPEVQGEMFLFKTDEDVAAFNSLSATLADLVDEQVAAIRDQQEKINAASNKLREMN